MSHIHKKIDFTVEVFIVYRNRVLLRRHDKYDKWLGVGGHIEVDEDPNQAAKREVKEEVGLKIKLYSPVKIHNYAKSEELIPPIFINRHRINKIHEHVTLIYFATAKSDKLKMSEVEVSRECHWFSKKELLNKKGIIPEVRDYAALALNTIK
jgi:8-oxo-dGTP pyrophosphatase MutT (NUDIX family)